MSILNVEHLTHGFGDRAIFNDVSFRLLKGEHIGLIGANGEGKSTFMNIITGKLMPDEGKVEWAKNVRVGYLDQHTVLTPGMTIRQVLASAFDFLYDMEAQMNEICDKMGDATPEELEQYMEDLGTIQDLLTMHDFYMIDAKVEEVARALGLMEIGLDRDVTELSGGQRTKVLLGKLLLEKPDILLLDEPTNYLDAEHIEWLKRYLNEYENAFILISHDIPFLNSVINLIYHMDNQELTRYVGDYDKFQEVYAMKKSQLEAAYNRQQKEIARMEELIEKFRYKKNKAAFAQSKIKYRERMEKIEDPTSDDHTFHARFHTARKGGRRVLEVEHLQIGYDHPLCEISLSVTQGQRVAVIGPNGHGKSTLMKTLMHQVPALSGTFLLGHQIDVGYFDQELAQFDSSKTVLEEVWDSFPDLDRTSIRTALGSFLFTQDEVFKTVDCLSGGEKVRLSLVKLMLSKPNFLMLDEPTNHLDLLGKEALEESLGEYEGTMLFVSHDRYFISKLATAILEIKDGQAVYYPLTYEEYLEKDRQAPKEQAHEAKESGKKPYVRNFNYSKAIRQLEEQIEKKETELEALRELRFEPEYYHDFKKMNELDQQIDDVHVEIDRLMQKWEEYSEQLEQNA